MPRVKRVTVVNSRGPRGKQGPTGTAVDGATGAAGLDGSTALSYNDSQVTNATASFATLKSYSIIAGQLASVGSKIIGTATIDVDVVTGVKAIEIQLDGTTCHTEIISFIMQEGVKEVFLDIEITYTAATTVDIKIKAEKIDVAGLKMHDQKIFEKAFTVSNMSTNANLLDIRGKASGSGDIIRGQELSVTYKAL